MIRVGIVAAAHLHADAYANVLRALPDAQLVGLWDADAERLAGKSAQYKTQPFAERAALLDACDAVIICAENVHHEALVIEAAQAGRAVLCEKPLATTPEAARRMIAACAQANVPLMTAFPCRFSPVFEALKNNADNGALGEVLAVCATNRGRCPGGWFVDPALSGGGAITDHTVHVVDLLRVLLGAEVESVYCEADNRLLGGVVEDTALVTLTFANGVFATLDASWSRPQVFPTWGDVTLRVTGSGGVIEADLFAQQSTWYNEAAGRISLQPWGSSIDHAMVAAFVQAVANNTPVPVSGEDGLRAVEVVAAAYQSVQTGQPVRIER